jgi:hypothetical protein
MITCKGPRDAPIVMKLSHFLRYYNNTHGSTLPQERADEEAAKQGIIIDRSGGPSASTNLPMKHTGFHRAAA